MEDLVDIDVLNIRVNLGYDCPMCCDGTILKQPICKVCNRKSIQKSEDDNTIAMCTKLEIEEPTDYVEFVKMIFVSDDVGLEKETNDPKRENVKEKVEEMQNVLNKEDKSSQTSDEICLSCPCCQHSLPWFGEGVTLKLELCHHTVCRWCMTNLLQIIIISTTMEPRCSFFVNNSYVCNAIIQQHEIRKLVEPKLYDAYLEKSIKGIKEDSGNKIVYCKTPTCQAWYIMEDDNVDTFLCTLCKVNNYVDKQSNEKRKETLTDIATLMQKERYYEILQLSERCIVPNFESFECPICFVQYKPQEGLILKNCLHAFCKECIGNAIIHSEDAEIKCPYKNDDYACDQLILQSEIRAIVKPDDFQKYLQKSITQVEMKAGISAYHCKTPNCPDWCFYEAGVDHFLCPTCNEDNCFLCQKIHTGKGCANNITSDDPDAISKQSEATIEMMLRNGNAIRCPVCHAVITKVSGCDSIWCASCKTQICWVTGKTRWGPQGIGDKSGGCKCEPHAKCHPNCRNCH